MIFLTVGSMLPFDRLVCATDAWAGKNNAEVFAQIGNSEYQPAHMRFEKMLTPSEFNRVMAEATLIIAHAGMGSVISAMEAGKPIVVVPRRAADREVTTDHQLHTARWLAEKPGIFVAEDEERIPAALEQAFAQMAAAPLRISDAAPPEFINKIRQFLLA